MIYGIPNNAQFEPLVRSVLLGLVCGVLWDFLRFFRRLHPPGRIRLFIEDILFFTMWSLLTFLLCYVYNFGIVRAYILLAQPFGFLLWYCLPGRLTYRLADWLLAMWQRFVVRPCCRLLCLFYRLYFRRKNRAAVLKSKKVKKSKKSRKNISKLQKKACK